MLLKKLLIYTIVIITSISWIACLTYKTVRVDIVFNQNFDEGQITVTYVDINSSEADPEKQMNDFEDLRGLVEDNVLYLDAIEDGIYVKDINLEKQDNRLIGTYTGIFRNLKIDGKQLIVKNEERSLVVEKEKGDRIKTNAEVLESEEMFLLVWPRAEQKIWYEVTRNYDSPVYPLLTYYDQWQQEKQ